MMTLHALSPLDGRYEKETAPLRDFFSEFAYLRARARIELDFLTALSKLGICPPPSLSLDNFTDEDALKIQEYEKTTRHDVKAIEYFLRERLSPRSLISPDALENASYAPSDPLSSRTRGSLTSPDALENTSYTQPEEPGKNKGNILPWLHFGLTSEDINNIAQALALRDSRDQVLLPALDDLLASLRGFAKRYRALPMLARTHGQPAVPTTLGKEIAVSLARLKTCRDEIAKHKFEAKLTGAVGNLNALHAAHPNIDWLTFSKDFIQNLGLEPNLVTTQILPYDNWIRYFQSIQLANNVLLGYTQDMWRYISDGWLRQKVIEGEVGSSTMPQKVNPIDFENAEGNLGIANALLAHFAQKLAVSRLQRDLSDSTVRRTFGTALGHTLLAWINITKGMSRVEADEERIKSELNAHWEVVSEGAQTILRAAGRSDAYEALKSQTRGRSMDSTSYRVWVEALDVDEETRTRLSALSPELYIGLAVELADQVLRDSIVENRNTE